MQTEEINNQNFSSHLVPKKDEPPGIHTTFNRTEKNFLEFREELKKQSTNLQSLFLSIDRLNCRCHNIEDKVYDPGYSALTKVDFSCLSEIQEDQLYSLFCKLSRRNRLNDIAEITSEVEKALKELRVEIRKPRELSPDLYSILEKHSSQLSKTDKLQEQLDSLRSELTNLNTRLDWLETNGHQGIDFSCLSEEQEDQLYLLYRKLFEKNGSFLSDLEDIYKEISDLRTEIRKPRELSTDLYSVLENYSSQQSELWQLARRTSREVSEARAGVWESPGAIKLKQAQDEQSSKLYAQDIAFAEMRKRLDALEAENRSLRQEIKKQEDLRKKTEKESEEGVNPGKILLLLIIGLIIIGFLNNS